MVAIVQTTVMKRTEFVSVIFVFESKQKIFLM